MIAKPKSSRSCSATIKSAAYFPRRKASDLTNAAAVAEAKIILAEMAKVKAELEAMLGLPM
jgi:hypothetical protein